MLYYFQDAAIYGGQSTLQNKKIAVRPSPCGEGGLKYRRGIHEVYRRPSLPVRGGWIEIKKSRPYPKNDGSLPVRENGLKCCRLAGRNPRDDKEVEIICAFMRYVMRT